MAVNNKKNFKVTIDGKDIDSRVVRPNVKQR